MSHFVRRYYDKLLFALAVAMVSGSVAWMRQGQVSVGQLRQEPVAAELSGALHELVGLSRPEAMPAVWPEAPAQSHGSGWVYEVFTPPAIYHHRPAGSFTVGPPLHPAGDDTRFGLELMGVRREPYRLQLAGYFGGPGDYRAALVSPDLPEALIVRAGERFDRLGFLLKSFDVRKVVVGQAAPSPVYDVAALAVVLDEKTGTEVVLDSRTRKFTDTPVAVCKLLTGDGASRELHEGDTFSEGGSTYDIRHISLNPPEVTVARSAAGLPRPETKVLRPLIRDHDSAAEKHSQPRPVSARSLTGVATAKK